MVYYGTFSKGCERCRQRKVKCDMRKPGCSKCEKSAKECPGYRNLSDILFRDESKRIVRKIRKDEQSRSSPSHTAMTTSVAISEKPSNDNLVSMTLVQLCQPVNELGANFFFSKYTFNESPFAGDYHEWLTRSYVDENHVLRAAIEAVGTAALSNVYYAPHIASNSQERYCNALAAINQALGDPVEAVADTTLMAIILLGLFETVTFATSDRYGNWAAHVNGATEVLKLRGRNQFNRPRQGLLYVMIRSQILMVCMQQHLRVPLALEGMTSSFQSSDVRKKWQQHKIANQGSMCQISFRIVNLSASLHDGEFKDPREILEIALEIERDLEIWRQSGPREWGYITVLDCATAAKDCFDGKLHIYPSSWAAEAWNNWRILKIYVKHVILEHELRVQVPDQKQVFEAVSVIRQLSIEICMSAFSFHENPRISSLIRPLYFVASEVRNSRRLRCFAIEQLQYIGSSMGIRQASLLANDIAQSLDATVETDWIRAGVLTIPLVPFF